MMHLAIVIMLAFVGVVWLVEERNSRLAETAEQKWKDEEARRAISEQFQTEMCTDDAAKKARQAEREARVRELPPDAYILRGKQAQFDQYMTGSTGSYPASPFPGATGTLLL